MKSWLQPLLLLYGFCAKSITMHYGRRVAIVKVCLLICIQTYSWRPFQALLFKDLLSDWTNNYHDLQCMLKKHSKCICVSWRKR